MMGFLLSIINTFWGKTMDNTTIDEPVSEPTLDDIKKSLSEYFKGFEVLISSGDKFDDPVGFGIQIYDMLYHDSEWKKIAVSSYFSRLDLGERRRHLQDNEKLNLHVRLLNETKRLIG